jgi:hypothetical protein
MLARSADVVTVNVSRLVAIRSILVSVLFHTHARTMPNNPSMELSKAAAAATAAANNWMAEVITSGLTTQLRSGAGKLAALHALRHGLFNRRLGG